MAHSNPRAADVTHAVAVRSAAMIRAARVAGVFVVAAAFTSSAAAQTAPWEAPPPLPSQAAPPLAAPPAPRLLLAPPMEPAVRRDPDPGTRYFYEALAGIGLGVGVGGALIGAGVLSYSFRSTEGASALFGLGALAFYVGMPLGVTLVGNARGGNGGYGWSVLGNLVGVVGGGLVGGGLILGVCSGSSGGSGCVAALTLGSLVELAGSVAGSILGYELSNDAQHPPTPEPPRWNVVFAPTRGGLSLGAALTM